MFAVYYSSSSYWGQVESNGVLNIRLGARAFGFGIARQIRERKRTPWWWPFPVRLEFLRPVHACGMQELCRLGCAWLAVSYTTCGETKPGDFHWPERGWHAHSSVRRR